MYSNEIFKAIEKRDGATRKFRHKMPGMFAEAGIDIAHEQASLDTVYRYELRIITEKRVSVYEQQQHRDPRELEKIIHDRAVKGISRYIYGEIYAKLDDALEAVYNSGIDEDSQKAVDAITEAMNFCKP